MNKYSVLMTVYISDSVTQLGVALDSIAAQTVIPSEFFIVGDGPLGEDVKALIKAYQAKLDYIKFFQIDENVGLGEALNVGLSLITENIVMRMDADDYSVSCRAETLLQELANNDDLVVVGSNIGEFDESFSDCRSVIEYPENVDFLSLVNYKRDPVGHAATMFYKDAILAAGGYKHCLFFEDTYLWLRLAQKSSGKFKTIQKVLYFARVGNGFYKRRSGVSYIVIEIRNFITFYSEGLITLKSMVLNIATRPFIRLLPTYFISLVYKMLLRKRFKC